MKARLSKAKEAGSRKFSVRKIICDQVPAGRQDYEQDILYPYKIKIEGAVVTKLGIQTIQKIAESLGILMKELLK